MSERFVVQGESVIVDRETGLMWQRVPSQDRMVWKEGFGYVETLNKESFGGGPQAPPGLLRGLLLW
jgi:hypothetical protein